MTPVIVKCTLPRYTHALDAYALFARGVSRHQLFMAKTESPHTLYSSNWAPGSPV